MAFSTKDPNSVGGTRKPANHAMSSNDGHKGSTHPVGQPPKPRHPSAYHLKSHAPYDGARKRAANSIAEPPMPKMPKYDISRSAIERPMLKTTKAD